MSEQILFSKTISVSIQISFRLFCEIVARSCCSHLSNYSRQKSSVLSKILCAYSIENPSVFASLKFFASSKIHSYSPLTCFKFPCVSIHFWFSGEAKKKIICVKTKVTKRTDRQRNSAAKHTRNKHQDIWSAVHTTVKPLRVCKPYMELLPGFHNSTRNGVNGSFRQFSRRVVKMKIRLNKVQLY